MSEAAIATPPAAAPAAPAPSPAAPAPTAAAPTPAAPSPAPAAPAAAPAPSLLARGEAAAPSPAPATATPPASPIPEKFHVKKADGSVDHEATAAKMGEAYANLEKRLGTGDAPPATPEDYAPTLPPGLKLDEMKKDPLFNGFLKGAHAKGLTNAQVSYVLESYAARQSMASSPEVGEAELRKVWPTDDQLQRGLADSFRATSAFTNGDADLAARVEAKFGNDPDFVRLMANVGKELAEDTAIPGGLTGAEQQSLESLMASPAYLDGKHPEHAATLAKVQTLYAKRYPERG